jgi:AcrR family transcriptional regulator
MTAKPVPLEARKRQFAHESIWEAAIALFAEKGFEQVTVDEVAQAAGISRRTFFRYFNSKNDLLAQTVIAYGEELSRAVRACPRDWPLLRVLETVALEVGEVVADRPHVQQLIRIAESCESARMALLSSSPLATESLAEAYAGRLRKRASDPLRARLLASITLSIVNVTIQAWGESESREIAALMKEAFATLGQLAD